MLADETPSLIKIDVEGMEISVLESLKTTVAQHKPRIFIEVDDANRAAFDAWCKEHDYRIAGGHKRYKTNENFLIVFEDDTYDGELNA